LIHVKATCRVHRHHAAHEAATEDQKRRSVPCLTRKVDFVFEENTFPGSDPQKPTECFEEYGGVHVW
jgi:hypothetical protein